MYSLTWYVLKESLELPERRTRWI